MKRFKDSRSFFKKSGSLSTTDYEKQVNVNWSSSNLLETAPSISEENLPEDNNVLQNTTIPDQPNRLGTLQTGPLQPHMSFPKTRIGNKLRFFSSKYYEYSWVEYNTREDKVYSFVCRHFMREGRDKYKTFVKTGFNNWKKLGERLKKRTESSFHSKYAEKYVSYLAHAPDPPYSLRAKRVAGPHKLS